jgi:hypothetical protein
MQALLDKPIRFAFAPSRGMVRLADTGAINSECILTDLLAIPSGNKNALFKFLSEYGFLFPLSNREYEAVDMDSLFGVVNRVKVVVKLMGAIGEPKKDYRKILGLTQYLLLSRPVEFSLSCFGIEPFKTCEHPLYSELSKSASLSQFSRSATDSDESYSVADTIFRPSYSLSIDEYNNIIGGFEGASIGAGQSQGFKDITRLYCNAPNLPHELRRAIDLLFHYQRSIGVVKSYDSDGTVAHYDAVENIKKRYAENFNDVMKSALIDVAKNTIRDEIGYNLGGMRPQYNVEMMSPSWEIQDLLTGIYVSIFFMRPGIELYRQCSNPSCSRMFLVNTTSSKRKYCCSPCRNAAAQRAHRLRRQTVE